MIVLKATQGKIYSNLQSVCGIVEKRHTVPILANVMIKKVGSSIQLTTSDLEVQIQMSADLGGDEGDFSTTVSAKKLMEILGTMPSDQSVTLESSQGKLLLKGGKSRFSLQTLPSEDYPLLQESSDYGQKFSIPQKTLKTLLNQVSFSMASHDLRYYLNGVLFEAEGNTLNIVSTDGHRLALANAELAYHIPNKQAVIIPRKTVLELARLLSDSEDAIEIQFANNQARIDFDGRKFLTKLIDGKFPDYNRVIPTNQSNVIYVGRLQFLATLKRIAIMTTDKFKGVKLNFDSNLLKVSVHNVEQEEASDEIEIEYNGAPIEVGFNVGYLIDVLSILSQEKVQISLADGASSALFTLPEKDSFKYVVMPMRI